jgi:GT2 family glycosyltransferase
MSTEIVCYASAVRRYPNGYELFMPAIGSNGAAPSGEEIADYLLYNARKHGLFYGAGTPTCALMASVSTLRAIGGFDASLRRVEDVDVAIRLALRGSHFVGTKKLLVVQYATVSADKSALKNFQSESLLVEKYATYLRTKRSYSYAKRWFYIRYLHFDRQKVLFTINIGLFFMRYPIRSFKHFVTSVPKRWLHERRMRKSVDLAK